MKSIRKISEPLFFIGTNAVSTGCTLLTSLLSLFAFAPTQRGQYILSALVGSLLASSFDFGIGVSAVQRRSGASAAGEVIAALDWLVFARVCIIFAISIAIYLIGVRTSGEAWATTTALGALGAAPLIALSSYTPLSLLRNSARQYNFIILAQSIIPLFIFSIFFFFRNQSVDNILISLLLLNVALSIWVFSAHNRDRARFQIPNYVEMWRLLVAGAPIGYTYFLNLLVSRGWYFLLSNNIGVAVVGVFSFAHSIAERLTLIGDGVGQSLFKKSLAGRRGDLPRLFKENLALVSILVIAAIFALSLVANFIFYLLPIEYHPANEMLLYLLVPSGLLAIYRVCHHLLVSTDKATESFKGYLVSGLTLVATLSVMLDRLGWVAAAVAFLIANCTLLIWGLRAVSLNLKHTGNRSGSARQDAS
jgi:O-antigen/teichoic acid export membrane protein